MHTIRVWKNCEFAYDFTVFQLIRPPVAYCRCPTGILAEELDMNSGFFSFKCEQLAFFIFALIFADTGASELSIFMSERSYRIILKSLH